jgi:hypothetical protein
LIQRCAIQPDRAGRGRPNPDQCAGERGFARAGSTDHAHRLPRFKREVDPAQHRLCLARWHKGQSLDLYSCGWAGQRRAWWLNRGAGQKAGDAVAGLARTGQDRPLANGNLYRLQGPAHQDRARNHRTGRHLSAQHQPCANPKHCRLQEQAEGLGDGCKGPCRICRRQRHFLRLATQGLPACKGAAGHAQGADQLGFRFQVLGLTVSPQSGYSGVLQGRFGEILVCQRDDDQQHHAADGSPAHPGVKHKQHRAEDRRPGQVEQRHFGG